MVDLGWNQMAPIIVVVRCSDELGFRDRALTPCLLNGRTTRSNLPHACRHKCELMYVLYIQMSVYIPRYSNECVITKNNPKSCVGSDSIVILQSPLYPICP